MQTGADDTDDVYGGEVDADFGGDIDATRSSMGHQHHRAVVQRRTPALAGEVIYIPSAAGEAGHDAAGGGRDMDRDGAAARAKLEELYSVPMRRTTSGNGSDSMGASSSI